MHLKFLEMKNKIKCFFDVRWREAKACYIRAILSFEKEPSDFRKSNKL